MRKLTFAAAMGTLALALATSASATTISWGASQTITANANILNPANVVDARNYGNATANISVTVGSETVVFTPASGINSNNRLLSGPDYFDSTGTSVTADFESVLDSNEWDNTAAGTISFSGLTDGGSYTLQVFSSDDRGKDWETTLGIGTMTTALDVTGKASLFNTATIDLAPGETSFSVDVTGTGGLNLWMVNAAVLATVPVVADSVITWSSPATTAISTNAATASANVDTNLTQTVLVWEETATAPSPSPGTTSDWSYVSAIGPTNAGSVSGEITSLAADTQYTWRFYGENATTSAWSAATTFVTDLSDAQAPEFTNAAASANQIQLSWDVDNAANETGYVLQRSTSELSGYITIDGTIGATTVTYVDTGLTLATTYYYQLAATNSTSGGSVTDFSLCRTNATTAATSPGYDDFASDPNIAGDWTNSVYYTAVGSATWNAGDQDLDLSTASQQWGMLRRTTDTRGATDTVTLDVESISQSTGNWGLTGIVVSQVAEPDLVGPNNTQPRYIFTLETGDGGATWFYAVRKDSHTTIYSSGSTPISGLTFPITLSIERNGDDYDFKVNGATEYTGTEYSAAVHDGLVYYHVTWGSEGSLTSTVDNFGVPPPSGTMIFIR